MKTHSESTMPPTHTPGLNFIYLLLALIICIGYWIHNTKFYAHP